MKRSIAMKFIIDTLQKNCSAVKPPNIFRNKPMYPEMSSNGNTLIQYLLENIWLIMTQFVIM